MDRHYSSMTDRTLYRVCVLSYALANDCGLEAPGADDWDAVYEHVSLVLEERGIDWHRAFHAGYVQYGDMSNESRHVVEALGDFGVEEEALKLCAH